MATVDAALNEALRKYQEITLYPVWPIGMSACQDAWVNGYMKARQYGKSRILKMSQSAFNRQKHRQTHITINGQARPRSQHHAER